MESRCFLLERGCDQGRRCSGGGQAFFDRLDCCRFAGALENCLGCILCVLTVRFDGKRRFCSPHQTAERPVIAGSVSTNLGVAFGHQTECGCLTATRRQLGGNSLPEHAANRKSDKHIQHRAGLLGVHAVHVQTARGSHGRLNRWTRDFVKDDAGRSQRVEFQEVTDVPGNTFALAIIVCRQPNLCRLLGRLFQF